MNNLTRVIMSNIRNVTLLAKFPAHQLRVAHSLSCLPEIYHEDRSYAFLFRSFSGDSRKIVLNAIDRTLLFFLDGLPITDDLSIEIRSLDVPFRDGIHALEVLYERDMYVYERCQRILNDWNQICSRLFGENYTNIGIH